MSFYTFVDEPFYSVAEMRRMMDDALHTIDHGVRSGAAQQAAQRAQAADQQVQRQGERRNLGGFQPKMDVHENPETKLITATFELPGLRKEDVNIDLHKNRLIISGETNFASDKEENGFVVKERRRGRFSRSIPLPQNIPSDQIKASMENGLLTVTFPKSSPEQQPQKITIA